MLRTQTPDVYDQWVKNEIPFNDPAVVDAHRHLRLDRQQRQDGRRWRQPRCGDRLPRQPEGPLRRAAEVLPAPPGVVHPAPSSRKAPRSGQDADFFYFPPYAAKPDLGKPVLGAGTLVDDHQGLAGGARLHRLPEDADRPRDLDGPAGGFLTPFKAVNMAAYASDALRKQGEILPTPRPSASTAPT